MQFTIAIFTALLAAGGVAASPLKRADTGSYTVSGLGERKQALTSDGGNTLDMAIAMLETETMTADYTYGDGKTGDSTNFGIFKQNWGMLRVCASQFQGQTTAQVSNGAVLNSDLAADIQALHDCQSYYGTDKWFGGHRNGATGLADYNTDDINTYKNAVYWIQEQLESSSTYLTDDTRFYDYVQAI